MKIYTVIETVNGKPCVKVATTNSIKAINGFNKCCNNWQNAGYDIDEFEFNECIENIQNGSIEEWIEIPDANVEIYYYINDD